ncbi:unnamed protein product [Amoebophrya sp. A25]|nr:unnamed protein product [Amoebophrya sp. A25]|eukprot:GSA25T00002203001.1
MTTDDKSLIKGGRQARLLSTCTTWKALAFLVSAGDDEVYYRENSKSFQRVFLRPRILGNVKTIDLSVKSCLGVDHKLPFNVSATALGKLYGPGWRSCD